MHIFIVSPYKEVKNLDKKKFLTNRLFRLFERMKRANLLEENKIKIIGVDGEDYDPELNKYLSDNWKKTYLRFSIGNKGCALSHIKIFQFIKENNIQEDILILEDDALIHENFKSFIPDQFPDDYHFLSLHSMCESAQEDFLKQEIKWSENIRRVTNYEICPLGSYAFFVNGRKISEILKTLLPLEWQIEFCTVNSPKFINYFYNPQIKVSGQETINDNQEFIDSYIRELNIFSKYFFMEFVNQEKDLKKIGDNFIFQILCHCTMLHGVRINDAYSFILKESDTNLTVSNIKFAHDWENEVTDQEYQKLNLKIKNPEILKHDTNYKLIVTYTEGKVDEVKKSFSKSINFTY